MPARRSASGHAAIAPPPRPGSRAPGGRAGGAPAGIRQRAEAAEERCHGAVRDGRTRPADRAPWRRCSCGTRGGKRGVCPAGTGDAPARGAVGAGPRARRAAAPSVLRSRGAVGSSPEAPGSAFRSLRGQHRAPVGEQRGPERWGPGAVPGVLARAAAVTKPWSLFSRRVCPWVSFVRVCAPGAVSGRGALPWHCRQHTGHTEYTGHTEPGPSGVSG